MREIKKLMMGTNKELAVAYDTVSVRDVLNSQKSVWDVIDDIGYLTYKQ
jgi:hypothetical protein